MRHVVFVLSLSPCRWQDFFYNPYPNRELDVDTEGTKVFPANERVQGRWNADVYDLDAGAGFSESDGGAWLLPYWIARAFNLLAPPTDV